MQHRLNRAKDGDGYRRADTLLQPAPKPRGNLMLFSPQWRQPQRGEFAALRGAARQPSARWSFRSSRRWRRMRRVRSVSPPPLPTPVPWLALGNFPGGMLIGAEKGLFLAHVSDGKVTVTPVRGDRDAERVLSHPKLARRRRADRGLERPVRGARGGGGTIGVVTVINRHRASCLRCATWLVSLCWSERGVDCSWRG